MDNSTLIQHYLDAQIAHAAEDWPAVKQHYQIILNQAPTAEIWSNLGQAHASLGDLAAALAAFTTAITLDPDFALGWYNLGFAHFVNSNWVAAKAALETCLTLDPLFPRAAFTYGNILRAEGNLSGAIDYYKAAVALDPAHSDTWNNMGVALQELRQTRAAADAFLEVVRLEPQQATPHMNLGFMLLEIGQFEGAKKSLQRALDLQPDYPEAHNNLGSALSHQGQHAAAITHYRLALAQRPNFKEAHSNLLFCVLHKDGTDLAEVAALHQEWFAAHGAPHVTATVFPNLPDPNRKLKIGFVSGDFRSHPVGFFVIRTIEGLAAHPDFDIYLYANQYDEDAMTTRFKNSGAVWANVWGDTDDALKDRIMADSIDILVDLTGHNDRHRMGLFARRAAPVQVTWAGYMATTGLTTIDWLLGDRYQTPASDQPFYIERLYQLPDSFICYTPPDNAPAPAVQTPAAANGYITFGCFNKLAKMSPRVIGLWARILTAVPQSKLLLKFAGLDDPETIAAFRAQFAAAGLGGDRIIMEGVSPHAALLARYNDIDIALDPLPYTGSTTTLEALWMSVPVVTLPGTIFPARHSYGYLSTVGLPELIAADADDYVQKVIALAQDIDRLNHYRHQLRQQMAASPLCDAPRFTAHFSDTLKFIWQDWCQHQS